MSIYATCWEIRIDDPAGTIELICQAVPAHIGQPAEDYEEDPYSDFLPPITPNYDPYSEEDQPSRAFVLVQHGRHIKVGQQYTEALMTLTNDEYEKMTINEVINKCVAIVSQRDKAEGKVVRGKSFSENIPAYTLDMT